MQHNFSIRAFVFIMGIAMTTGAQAGGRYDDVEVIPLHTATNCWECLPCSPDPSITGTCGERYVANVLRQNGFAVYIAQEQDDSMGVDLIAIKRHTVVASDGRLKFVPLIVFHESKCSQIADVSAGQFYGKLGKTPVGHEVSRTWLNHALGQMKVSHSLDVSRLAHWIDNALRYRGAYFIRTGNLKVEQSVGMHYSVYMQVYALRDGEEQSQGVGIKRLSPEAKNGPLVQYVEINKGQMRFAPGGRELELNPINMGYLKALFGFRLDAASSGGDR